MRISMGILARWEALTWCFLMPCSSGWPTRDRVCPALFALVKPGGALAVQVPACTPARSAEGRLETCDAHRLMADTAREAPFAAYTAGCTRLKTLEAPGGLSPAVASGAGDDVGDTVLPSTGRL